MGLERAVDMRVAMVRRHINRWTFLPTAAILVLGICLVIAGCTAKRDDKEVVRLRYWTFPLWSGVTGTEKNGTPEDWPRLKIKEFEALHPGVKIDLEVVTWQGGSQKIDLAVLSGTYPDVCYLAASNLRKYVDQGVLEPIDGDLTKADIEDIYPNVLSVCRLNDRTYMWPWLCNALIMAVNVDIFKERHIEHLIPKPPERAWTYDQFLEACKACTFVRKNGSRVYGYALYGIPLTVEYQMLTLVRGFGATVYSKDGSKFLLNSPEGRKGFQFLLDLLDKHKVTPPGPAGIQGGQVGQMFMNQELATESATSGVIKEIKRAAERGDFPLFNAAIVQPPHLPGHPPPSMLSVGGYVVFRQTDRRKRQLAMEFARFLSNTENCRALTANGQFPARRSAGDIYPGDVDMGVVARMIPLAKVYYTSAAPELGPVLNNIYQEIFTHNMTVDQALADAEAKATAIIAREMADQKVGKPR